jgi:predicted RNase H-like HicB family nuclease
MRQFVALIFSDPDGGFAATFPDLPGCVAFASALLDAPGVATRALAERLEDMEARGERIPEPSRIEDLIADNANAMALHIPPSDDAALFHAASNDEWPEAEA